MTADLRIRPDEARLAKAHLAAAYSALRGRRINPIRWLALVQRRWQPNSPTGRIAGLLAALAPDHADVRLRDLSHSAALLDIDTRAALAALTCAGFLETRATLRTASLEMTLRLPGTTPDPEGLSDSAHDGPPGNPAARPSPCGPQGGPVAGKSNSGAVTRRRRKTAPTALHSAPDG